MKLKGDMLTLDGAPAMSVPGWENSAGTGFEGKEFYEASSLRRIGEKYYLIYSTINSHELAYAVSDAPDGTFTYGGVLLSNGDFTGDRARTYWGNNHGSVEQLNGQWYVFYHRQTNKTEQSRQGCAEPVLIGADGSIAQVRPTSCGLNGGPLAGYGTYPAYIACNVRSAKGVCKCAYGPFRRWTYAAHPCITQEGATQYIANMRRGSEAVFRDFDLRALRAIAVEVRGGAGVMEVFLGDAPIASIPIGKTRKRARFQADCLAPDGVHALTFRYIGKGRCDFFSFTLIGGQAVDKTE